MNNFKSHPKIVWIQNNLNHLLLRIYLLNSMVAGFIVYWNLELHPMEIAFMEEV